MAQLPSGMSCVLCVWCVRVVGRGCTGQAAMACGTGGLGLRIGAGRSWAETKVFVAGMGLCLLEVVKW